jgi:hypothetical protein
VKDNTLAIHLYSIELGARTTTGDRYTNLNHSTIVAELP